MKILVTGARGFVGEALVPALEARGHEVVGIDREDGDLAEPDVARLLVRTIRPDYIVHLAARYGRLLCAQRPRQAVCDNAAATTELAAIAAERGLGVLYASSSEVYGDHGGELIGEDSELREPTTIYGLSKRWGEEVLRLYLPPDRLTIARLNMLYGPRQRAGFGCCALATFIRDALEGRPLQVHRNASRSWLYISDAAEGLAKLTGKGGTWNVGNGSQQLAMEELAKQICGYFPDASYELLDAPDGQIRHKVYDASRLEALGWRPEVSLAEGLEATINWARQEGMVDYEEAA